MGEGNSFIFGNFYTEAVLKFKKLNTQAQQREAVVQGRSLSPYRLRYNNGSQYSLFGSGQNVGRKYFIDVAKYIRHSEKFQHFSISSLFQL
ncbi:MAG: hypothetical protein LBL62_05160 [Planctomycetaceae bacterium]|nr:hypothetical protein [Planctomycetaceae bacterium]